MGHTCLFWIGKFDGREFRIRALLFFHGDEGLEAKALEASTDEYMADAVHGSVDKLDIRRFVESSRENAILALRKGKSSFSPHLYWVREAM